MQLTYTQTNHSYFDKNLIQLESSAGGKWCRFLNLQSKSTGGGEAVKYEMDTGVRAALRQAGAFSESTGSKNEGSLGESMIFGIQWEKNTKICGAEVIGWEQKYHKKVGSLGVPYCWQKYWSCQLNSSIVLPYWNYLDVISFLNAGL